MKTRIAILVIVVALLLTGSVTLAQSGGRVSYALAPGMLSGGRYHLTSLAWQVSGATSSDSYHLLSPAVPISSENGCCCTYLPCILRNY